MNKLTRIQLSGFKSIREMDFILSSLNVLIGANGAGKSNFLSFFRLLNHIMTGWLQGHIETKGGANAHLYYGTKRTPQMECTLHFDTDSGSNIYYMRLIHASGDRLIFADEKISYTRKNSQSQAPLLSLGGGHKETMLLSEDLNGSLKKTARTIRDLMNFWRFYQFHDTSDTANIKMPALIDDNRYLRADAGNIAAYLYFLKQKYEKHYKLIVTTIRQIAPFFDDFILLPSRLNPNQIKLQWKEKAPDSIFEVNQLSDGTLRMIALITLLLQPQLPPLIVIDEPELGLHPYALQILASLLKSAAEKSQLIVSTQSVSLVDALEPEDLVVVNRKDGQSVFERLSEEKLKDWLQEYTYMEAFRPPFVYPSNR